MDKICTRCKQTKPIEAFYKRTVTKKHPSGFRHDCKECGKASARDYKPRSAYKNREYYAVYKHTDAYKQRMKLSKEVWRKKYPERHAAKIALGHAVGAGKVTKQPCLVCGSLPSEGHHPAYDMPLDVVWLCMTHHRELHAEHRNRSAF